MSNLILCVCNSKGGCSKSTTSMLLASALSRHLNVVVADSDPQGTASLWGALGRFPCPVRAVSTEADIRAALNDTLCRCGAHVRIVRAIQRAAVMSS